MPKILASLFNYLTAIIVIILTLPLQIIIFLLLLLELKEFPLFIQERGLTLTNGKFRIVKFKTISTVKAHTYQNRKEFLLPIEDKSVTTIATKLRKSGLDELPQLFQVLSGKMNIVGPRPLMISDLKFLKEKYPDDYKKRNSINLKPGITGLWQLYGNKSNGIEDLTKYDIMYFEKSSLKLDIALVARTVIYIFSAGKKSINFNYD